MCSFCCTFSQFLPFFFLTRPDSAAFSVCTFHFFFFSILIFADSTVLRTVLNCLYYTLSRFLFASSYLQTVQTLQTLLHFVGMNIFHDNILWHIFCETVDQKNCTEACPGARNVTVDDLFYIVTVRDRQTETDRDRQGQTDKYRWRQIDTDRGR